jgi:hypothetical protein
MKLSYTPLEKEQKAAGIPAAFTFMNRETTKITGCSS